MPQGGDVVGLFGDVIVADFHTDMEFRGVFVSR